MSTLEATTVQPRTIQVGIVTAAQTATYQLAPGLAQYVQAVYAEVTNNSGTDVSPLLTVSEQTGVVIAKKRQTGTIPDTESGSGTWALRLLDEGAGGASATGIFFDQVNEGQFIEIDADTGPPGGSYIILFGKDLMQIETDDLFTMTADAWLVTSNSADFNTNGRFQVQAKLLNLLATDTTITITSGTDLVLIGGDNTRIRASLDTIIKCSNTRKVQVTDHSNNPIFEVRDDGSLHGKTGASLTFDL